MINNVFSNTSKVTAFYAKPEDVAAMLRALGWTLTNDIAYRRERLDGAMAGYVRVTKLSK